MNILTKVTNKTLLKNRTRTVVTVIGIILSAAMFTAVTTTLSSAQQYLKDLMVATQGYWHGYCHYMPASDRERLEADGRIDSAAYAQIVGYARAWESGDISDQFPYLYVLGGDETFYERMPVHITAGRLPQDPGEIVLRNGRLGAELVELGSTVTLELGDRTADGTTLNNYNPYIEGETLTVREKRTYTVVGYMDAPQFENYNLPGQMALTCWDGRVEEPYLDVYFLAKDPRDTFDLQRDLPYASQDNRDYLMALGVVRYDNFYRVLFALAAILIGLIMFGSVSLIYNAFSISVAERTKQFGLLRSVGATRKQIRSMVFTEAVTVSAIGIPLGILSGVLGMTVTLHFIGRDLAVFFDGEGSNVVMTMHVSLWSVIAAAAIGFVTVLISAWVPSRRAMRISAIEAIRQSNDVAVKRREVRTSPLTYRLFGLEGAIAGKHFKRARRRYRATVVSLFMSVVLFISASSFCRYLTDSVSGAFSGYDYDIRYSFHGTEAEESGKSFGEALAITRQARGVTEVSALTEISVSCLGFTRDQTTREGWALYDDDASVAEAAPADQVIYPGLTLYGVEDATWRAYLRDHGLDVSQYTGPDALGIVHSTFRAFDSDQGRYRTVTVLRDDIREITVNTWDSERLEVLYDREDYDDLPEEEQHALYEECQYYTPIKIGCQLEDLPMGCSDTSRDVVLLVPMSVLDALGGDNHRFQNIYFRSDDHTATMDSLESLALQNGLPGRGYMRDAAEQTVTERSLVTVVRVVSYGFIVLISLIAAANVFNTVSTNIFLRRREFAMLRSVGMTSRGFNRMMNYECLLYGSKSLIFGIPAAFGVTYLIFKAIDMGYQTDFYLPWSAVFIAVGSVFLVVFATMLYATSTVRRDNPIDALRSEVI